MRRMVDIASFMTGSVRCEQKDGWYSFYRFFGDQMISFENNIMFDMCAKMNAGLRMRLRTDASRLEFTARSVAPKATLRSVAGLVSFYRGNDKKPKFKGGSREPYGACFDFYVDGKKMPSPFDTKGCVSFLLGERGTMRTVEIIFPYMLQLEIRDVLLYECTAFEPVPDKKYALFLGDSVTQGADVIHPGNAWYRRVADAWEMDFLNQGVCGLVFTPATLSGLSLLERKPARIVCAFGTNDWGFSSATKKEQRLHDMRTYLSRLHTLFPETETVIVTPFRRLDEYASGTFMSMRAWRQTITEEAAQYANMRVIDGEALLPADADYFYDTFLHPNDKGAAYLAEHFLAAYEKREEA